MCGVGGARVGCVEAMSGRVSEVSLYIGDVKAVASVYRSFVLIAVSSS